MDRKTLERIFDFSLFGFGALSIALVGLGHVFWGAVAGLASEPGFFWASYKSKMWSMWVLSGWWTIWWAVTAYRTF